MTEEKGWGFLVPENLISKIFDFTNNGVQGGFVLFNLDNEGKVGTISKAGTEISYLGLLECLEEFLAKTPKTETKKSIKDPDGIPSNVLGSLYDYSGDISRGYLLAYINKKGVPKIAYDVSSINVKKGLRRAAKSFLDQVDLNNCADHFHGED
jgi:hypothetical protein